MQSGLLAYLSTKHLIFNSGKPLVLICRQMRACNWMTAFFRPTAPILDGTKEDGIRLSLFAIEDNQMATAPRFSRGQEVAFKLVRSDLDIGAGY